MQSLCYVRHGVSQSGMKIKFNSDQIINTCQYGEKHYEQEQ